VNCCNIEIIEQLKLELCNNLTIVCLLEAGADPTLKDGRGKTALDLYMGHVDGWDGTMQLFTDYGAPISWWDRMHRQMPFIN